MCPAPGSGPLTREEVDRCVAVVSDRMTECEYAEPLRSFDHGVVARQTRVVPVLERGADALKEVRVGRTAARRSA